jgi:hypothetical protein
VRLTRVVVVLGIVVYVFLWVLVANGASSLEVPLLLPIVLVVLIVAGLGLDRYLGLPHRQQHFQEPDDKDKQ